MYADVLFLVNLSMDFLTIYLTSKLTHAKATVFRSIAASVVGALYGVATVLWQAWYSIVGTAAVSVLITIIAFGIPRGLFALLRQSFLVFGCGTLLGGVVSALMALGEPVFTDDGGGSSYAGVYIVTFALAMLLVRLLAGRRDRRSAEIEVTVNGKTAKFTALCDSGNLLREPIGGAPVILVSAEAIDDDTRDAVIRFRETVESDMQYRFRIIPQKTVNGAGMLYGIVPDELTVDGVPTDAIIAIDENGGKNGYGGYAGIVPLCLCNK